MTTSRASKAKKLADLHRDKFPHHVVDFSFASAIARESFLAGYTARDAEVEKLRDALTRIAKEPDQGEHYSFNDLREVARLALRDSNE